MQAWESLKFSRSIKVGEFISSAVPPDTTYFRVAINKRAKTAEGIGARIFSRDLKLFLFEGIWSAGRWRKSNLAGGNIAAAIGKINLL